MPTFEELDGRSDAFFPAASESPRPSDLIAKRYRVLQRLGRGSFGCVYLVQDNKSRDEEPLKVLKEIPLGDLHPNQTVHASQEAQLLSQLHHPAILTFYSSFLERDSFCIITEYCQDRDLDCKLEEVREAGQSLHETQIIDWLIQLLLGLHYMHERRILHRDLKAKNIFLKRNLVKIGDFGVSCLLIGSCDLATTFTGTPYYMSPEVLNQQGYNYKSDIWALGCVLYEMCCLAHAFEGHSFLSVVMKIVEGETPTLPEGYSRELNSLMQRMLEKNPPLRISAEEALRTKIIETSMQSLKHKLFSTTLKDKESGGERDAAQIAKAVQKKVHLQTLRERSEVDRMTPRERMRLRKLEAADDKARRLRKLAEEKYQENHRRMQELRSRHFEKVSLDIFSESAEDADHQTLPITAQDYRSLGFSQPIGRQQQDRMCMSEPGECKIPEDPQTAEVYYDQDGFESCSEEEQDSADNSPALTSDLYHTCQQDSDLDAMIMHMENVLQGEVSVNHSPHVRCWQLPAPPQSAHLWRGLLSQPAHCISILPQIRF
ncbi:serine/threonine-protein kinase Nek11 isoform X3 [Hypomesus transpacificus]|uniref:serine/threonine-protein kinase Nek11 isoform X3 n=1 Tax=Hypomesus transpacificus TaxID=137520 RepID=UPI001F07A97A|nr:serine/threonine-protein kinase Nek11 isoform X3 [Hypomesus transpacificus]